MKLNCRAASRLISAGLDRPLSMGELLKLKMHLMLCGNCRQFSQQLGMLRDAARQAGRGGDASGG
ncbi:zf-HC2 domain-containing protein [Chromobacterium piscinae]|uniref:Zf-HC2 domain-containing protein n=1 Tax=Chromobacterium piscinae TaxID=686831 RepID=A0ABV0HCH2_9NEIS|nr:zf-HC2 domain-containing protein [Chromobacterium piscinae]MBX9299051.1 zf-HC2 domain-containing protein [Chromobacterium vaccinii]MBX9347238.1 zf-HC2 domain-containing protein [Chromobacterium vaccinii]MBX9358552.1 zf-HC2 domain-containing protein [Chromobacterium vaccinii]MCD4505302.1 zf-HC2 domain-containing protein [Chromobacterium piscinae]MCD5329534.1 zf-HC2 domain-containing protein [Chromobacterium piscinae]